MGVAGIDVVGNELLDAVTSPPSPPAMEFSKAREASTGDSGEYKKLTWAGWKRGEERLEMSEYEELCEQAR